jgi:hypothetical protein
MLDHLNLARFRNEGDEFHVLWTARRTLKMLDPSSRLVAVAIERVSGNELADGTRLEAGLLVIDTRSIMDQRNLLKLIALFIAS